MKNIVFGQKRGGEMLAGEGRVEDWDKLRKFGGGGSARMDLTYVPSSFFLFTFFELLARVESLSVSCEIVKGIL